MAEALDLNLRGLIYVLAGVVIREIERDVREASSETESDPTDADDKSIRRRSER